MQVKGTLMPIQCHGQGHLPLDQGAPSPVMVVQKVIKAWMLQTNSNKVPIRNENWEPGHLKLN